MESFYFEPQQLLYLSAYVIWAFI